MVWGKFLTIIYAGLKCNTRNLKASGRSLSSKCAPVFINRSSEWRWWLSNWRGWGGTKVQVSEGSRGDEGGKGETNKDTVALLRIATNELQSQSERNWFMLVAAFVIFMCPQWVMNIWLKGRFCVCTNPLNKCGWVKIISLPFFSTSVGFFF